MRYAYFPGCSLSRTARAYDLSTRAVADALEIELEEIEDWNCCGATEYISLNKTAAYALIARNLALAARQDNLKQIVAPCSLCFLNLRKADHYMGKYPRLGELANSALAAGGLSYAPGSLTIRHMVDVVVRDVGLDAIAAKVTNPLTGLRVAAYYGCLLVRPELGEVSENPEYPMFMDRLMSALGAEVVDFPLKAHCCGGHMTQISADTAFELIRRLLHNAAEYKADVIVTVCPMCQLNLDAYNLPILYFTQLIGLALGMDVPTLGIGQEIVSANEALRKIGTEIGPSQPERPARKKDDKSLPMPRTKVEA